MSKKQFVLGSQEWLEAYRDGAFVGYPPVPDSPRKKPAAPATAPKRRPVLSSAGFTQSLLQMHHGRSCLYCGFEMLRGHPSRPTREHIVPKSKGGDLNPENRLVVCAPCNGDKGDLTLENWAHKLTRRGDPRASLVWEIVHARFRSQRRGASPLKPGRGETGEPPATDLALDVAQAAGAGCDA
jgi:5-methylcytosine-specific restriction endonuclease McrA